MPRVRILTSIAGPGYSYRRGEVVDLPGELASQWCDGHRAELVRGENRRTPEEDGHQAVETTTTGSGQRRRRTRKGASGGHAEPA